MDDQTGYRALIPEITSMAGSVWKSGNTVSFFHGEVRAKVVKSRFSTTESAMALKTNTINYAQEYLARARLEKKVEEKLLAAICLSRDVLSIEDLSNFPGYPQSSSMSELDRKKFEKKEAATIEDEHVRYIKRVKSILAKADKIDTRDYLVIALGLKDHAELRENSIFRGDRLGVLNEILRNKTLLQQVMVTAGKVLIAGPSNNSLIDFLTMAHNVDINSVDEHGMTALHYAMQNFYNLRDEPIALIKKLLECGADVYKKNKEGVSPLQLALNHCENPLVMNKAKLLEAVLQHGNLQAPDEAIVKQKLSSLGEDWQDPYLDPTPPLANEWLLEHTERDASAATIFPEFSVNLFEKLTKVQVLNKDHVQGLSILLATVHNEDPIKIASDLIAIIRAGQNTTQAGLSQASPPNSQQQFQEYLKKYNLTVDQMKQITMGEGLACLHLFPTMVDVPKYDADQVEKLRVFVEAVETEFTGSVSISQESEVSSLASDMEHSQRPYNIASVGKVFTGVLPLKLVADGKISEDFLNRKGVVVPEAVINQFPLDCREMIRERLKEVSIHQLMTHQAGFGDFNGSPESGYFGAITKAAALGRSLEIKDHNELLKYADSEINALSESGQFRYSNVGMMLLAAAIEHEYNSGNNTSLSYQDLRIDSMQ